MKINFKLDDLDKQYLVSTTNDAVRMIVKLPIEVKIYNEKVTNIMII